MGHPLGLLTVTARQRREVMKRKKGTHNNLTVEENVNNGKILAADFT